jgi:hypothetical protein
MLYAFQVTDFYSGIAKDNLDLVVWDAKIVSSDGLPENEVEIPLGVHPCDDSDWDRFYPTSYSSDEAFQKMKTTEGAWCFDTQDADGNMINLSIYGQSESESHRRLDLSFRPCNPVVKDPLVDQSGVRCLIDDDSETSYLQKLRAAKDYIGEPSLNILTNRESIKTETDEIIYTTDVYN